ncbi:MAG: metallophosphoesterase [Clostridium sp.]|nr:metallophosphoesterase [Acetatifactor muris]MCM1528099.1 metallophosphoesterase [Bacteroides sp.]MCM1562118.1 metallophosphoesterase [Clostridium sp.]
MWNIVFTVLFVIVLVSLWIMIYDGNRFVVREHVFCDARIRRNVRAVVLADLHNKRYGRDNERLIAAVRKLAPDMILVAGDLLTARRGAELDTALHLLEELSKDYPIYYGNGNHEQRMALYPEVYGDMAGRYGEGLRKLGISPLANAHVCLADCGITIYGAELDKFYYKRFRVQPMDPGYMESILGKPDKSSYSILLAHNPDYFPRYADWGADLVLAGHVHGGLVRVPFWGRGVASPNIRFFPKYDGGRFDEKGSVMLVSRGLGVHTIPVRLFNPGEILCLEFKGADPQEPGI